MIGFQTINLIGLPSNSRYTASLFNNHRNGTYSWNNVDPLLHARWVITCEPNHAALDNHSIAIQNGLIQAPPAEVLITLSFTEAEIKTLNDLFHHMRLFQHSKR